jgi:hypothetical protein
VGRPGVASERRDEIHGARARAGEAWPAIVSALADFSVSSQPKEGVNE